MYTQWSAALENAKGEVAQKLKAIEDEDQGCANKLEELQRQKQQLLGAHQAGIALNTFLLLFLRARSFGNVCAN